MHCLEKSHFCQIYFLKKKKKSKESSLVKDGIPVQHWPEIKEPEEYIHCIEVTDASLKLWPQFNIYRE